MHMKTKMMAAALVAAVAASSAFADKVTLMSGSHLTGTAGDFAGGKLKFKSDELGDLEIPVEKIAGLESAKTHVVKYLDGTVETKALTVRDGDVAVVEGGGTKPLDTERVKEIDPEAQEWKGSLNFSGALTRGNSVGESASVTADASRRWEKDRFTAAGGYHYAASGDSREDKQKTMSRFELQAQEDHFWNGEGFYSYLNGKYEFDRIMNLEYRWRAGLGFGYQWFEDRDFGLGKSSFNQELGLAYVGEKYRHAEADDYATFRYAHHYKWDVAAVDGLAFVHNFEFLPQVDEFLDNYLVDSDAGVTYDLRANWQLLAKVEWDYKKKVGPATKHSDLRYFLGLGYKW